MKKFITISSIILIGSLSLAGCTSSPNTEDAPTTSATSAALTNPINNTETLVNETQFANGLSVKSYQIGFGYPTKEEVRLWNSLESTESAEPTPDSTSETEGSLDSSKRVVAIRYDVTNTTGSPIDVKTFNPRNGFFTDSESLDDQATQSASDDSLHGILNAASNPNQFDIDAASWSLAPGQTASWALDWLIPEEQQESESIRLTQNFSIGQDTWASGNVLTLSLNSKGKK